MIRRCFCRLLPATPTLDDSFSKKHSSVSHEFLTSPPQGFFVDYDEGAGRFVTSGKSLLGEFIVAIVDVPNRLDILEKENDRLYAAAQLKEVPSGDQKFLPLNRMSDRRKLRERTHRLLRRTHKVTAAGESLGELPASFRLVVLPLVKGCASFSPKFQVSPPKGALALCITASCIAGALSVQTLTVLNNPATALERTAHSAHKLRHRYLGPMLSRQYLAEAICDSEFHVNSLYPLRQHEEFDTRQDFTSRADLGAFFGHFPVHTLNAEAYDAVARYVKEALFDDGDAFARYIERQTAVVCEHELSLWENTVKGLCKRTMNP